jgi:hypothetical protein
LHKYGKPLRIVNKSKAQSRLILTALAYKKVGLSNNFTFLKYKKLLGESKIYCVDKLASENSCWHPAVSKFP